MSSLSVGRDDARSIVANGLGPILLARGFRALPSGLRFKRAVPEGTQEIDVILAMNPPYARGTIHFLPHYTWSLPKVGAVARDMIGGNSRIGRINDVVYFGQLASLSYKQEKADWYFGEHSQDPELTRQQAEFFARWVAPFCDEYKSAEDLVKGYFSQDPRLYMDLYEVPSVAAALIVLGRRDQARSLIESNQEKAENLHCSLQPLLEYIDRGGRPEGDFHTEDVVE